MTILDEEFAAAQQAFDAHTPIPGTSYVTTTEGTNPVVLSVVTDRSQLPMAEAVGGMIEDFRPELVAVVGIAGGLDGRDGVRLGDVVVPNYLHYWEFRKLDPSGADLLRYFAYDQPTVSIRQNFVQHVRMDANWTASITVARPDPGDPKVVLGSLVSAEKVWSDASNAELKRLIKRFTDAIAVDMESIGAARAIHAARSSVDYNPRLVIIRGISDIVRPASRQRGAATGAASGTAGSTSNAAQREKWKPYASAAAAAFCRRLVDRLVEVRDPRE